MTSLFSQWRRCFHFRAYAAKMQKKMVQQFLVVVNILKKTHRRFPPGESCQHIFVHSLVLYIYYVLAVVVIASSYSLSH